MNTLNSYIPSDKFDVNPIIELAKLDYPFYKDILFELIEWIKNINWPVAKLIAPLLVKSNKDIVPHIRIALKSKDDMWINWIFIYVIDKMEPYIKREIIMDLQKEMRDIVKDHSSCIKDEELYNAIIDMYKSCHISIAT